jgi:hypothetical protein
MQFFIRQLLYSNAPAVPAVLKNIVPFICPLHISLNARECVLLNLHQVFADLYAFGIPIQKKEVGKEAKTMAYIITFGSDLWGMDTN